MQKEDFKLGRMVLNVKSIEADLLFWAKCLRKVQCCGLLSGRLVKMATILGDPNDSSCFSVFPPGLNNRPQMSKTRTVLPLRFGNATTISNMAVFRKKKAAQAASEVEKEDENIRTCFTLPGSTSIQKFMVSSVRTSGSLIYFHKTL